MGVELYVGGDDFSEYVIESSRELSLCSPIGTLEVMLSAYLPRDIDPYENVEFYENGTLVFTGDTYTAAKSRLPIELKLTCYDKLHRTKDRWFSDAYISNGETVAHWVKKFLKLAGINSIDVGDLTDYRVYVGYGWDHMNCFEAIMSTLKMTPYQIFCDSTGTIKIEQALRGGDLQHTINSYTDYERKKSDSWIRNRVVVFGNGFTASDVENNDYLFPGEIRTTAIGTGQIHSLGLAYSLVDDMMQVFSTPLDVKIVGIEGDPSIYIGDVVHFTDSWTGYDKEDCVVTSLTSEYTASGYTMQVTLDEKCTNFWGWDLPPVPPPSPLYASTWGAGVYITRDYAQSWQATNLGSKYVYAISVPTDEEVWAACESGVYYTEDEGENWEKQTMGTPSAQRDGESISEADLYFVGVETYMDEVYCLAGEDASRGIWMYKSEDKGENWTNKRIAG